MKWIPIEGVFSVPPPVKSALGTLAGAGHVAYLVGGCVRDFLLQAPTKDYDIATSASPDEVAGLFADALTIGKQFGVIKLPVSGIEIATFREDVGYRDHRHPASVRFAGPAEDAQRRDFTINGLFYDPRSRKILDGVKGVEDLRARIIRAIGDPFARFDEDALRMLRAIRFAARFGFSIEPETWQAIQASAKLILQVSAERVRDELSLMFTGRDPAFALRGLQESGLLAQILPEATRASAKLLTKLAADGESPTLAMGWAAVLNEIGGDDPAKPLRAVCDRLKLPKIETTTVIALVSELPKFHDVFTMREATLQRWIREPHFAELLRLHRAMAVATDGNLMAHRFCQGLYLETIAAKPVARLLSGEDLIQLGFQPGPTFAEILRVVEDLTLERRLTTKGQALEYVVKHFVG